MGKILFKIINSITNRVDGYIIVDYDDKNHVKDAIKMVKKKDTHPTIEDVANLLDEWGTPHTTFYLITPMWL